MHRFLVLLASLLAISLALQCYDAGDKLINQRCFKLVNQKLSFADARNWCHYHNPVSPSYLAVVTDQTTTTFLASYARTSFNVNEGPFWIGLSRANSTSKFYWDNEQQLVWSNFELQTAQNYVAESVSNGKWTTYSGDTKMNFVCSYDPNAPPTFSPSTGSTPPMTDATETIDSSTPYTAAGGTTGWSDVTPTPTDYYDECLPSQKTTFLYGYSNDLDPQTVIDVTDAIVKIMYFYATNYVTYGNVRFDTVLQETIFLSHTPSSFEASVNSNLPDPNLGFQGSDRGSNVADMLRGFLSSNNTCGTFILLNMKRNVHDKDLTDVIESLRKHRVYVFTVASNEMVNSEDTFKQLHAMSVGSNGLLIYNEDSHFEGISDRLVEYFAIIYPYYVTSVQVSGNGSVVLPMLHKVPGAGDENEWISVGVTTQDHALPISNLQMEVDFNGPTETDEYRSGTFTFQGYSFDFSQDYNVTLKYQYADNETQTVDIRMYVTAPVNQWPPYPSN